MNESQQRLCDKYGVKPYPCVDGSKIGISLNVKEGVQPIHGLRCEPTVDTCGWYIWAGDWSDDPDFFNPLHLEHLPEWCSQSLPFLQLPPGWRFLIAPDYEDVWFDENLQL
ncbi:immunity protein Imm33 domain-containing protein [Stieleria neptunia]|nr:hypothetical protein [Stieleria neptunia]